MNKILYILFFLSCVSLHSQIRLGERKAFPTAIGHGKHAQGNLTNNVYLVTNLNASGSGSLADSRTLSNTTVQFDMGGEIGFNNTFQYWTGTNVTIAFETAPSPVVMRDGALMISGSEMIVRHMVGRRGYEAGMELGSPSYAGPRKNINVRPVASGGNISNIILDHLSCAYAHDETIGVRDDRTLGLTTNNVTIQNSLVAKSYVKYGILVFEGPQGVSLLRNGYFDIGDRTPESTRGQFSPEWEQLNSIIYNYDRPTVASFGSEAVNMNNVYKLKIGQVPNITNMRYQVGTTGLAETDGMIWSSGNIELGPGNATGIENSSWTTNKTQTGARFNSSGYEPISASETVSAIFDDLGATAWGEIDPIDIAVKNDYINGTGEYIIPTTEQPPSYSSSSHGAGYWATGNRVSQAFKNTHGFTDDMEKPDFFTVNGLTFDNREYTGGSYLNASGETVNQYTGGTLTGGNLYTWWDVFRFEKAKDFEAYKWSFSTNASTAKKAVELMINH